MKTIITIQHAQSIHHTNGMVGSWTDWDLTELGKRQADNIGKKLSKELQGKPFVMVSSDLSRAKQTAEIVAKHLQITPKFDKALRERYLGKCVGKSVQWLQEHIERDEFTVDDRMFSDAESRRDEWNRLLPFFQKLMAGDEENVIVVSHGDLLGVFNTMWLGLDVETLNQFELLGAAGGVSLLCENHFGKRMVRKLCDLSYLAD